MSEERKKVLWISTDGYAIHEGDEFYMVYKKEMAVLYNNGVRNEDQLKWIDTFESFLYKTNAEKWVDLNKKIYSKQDILNLLDKK